MTFTKHPRNLPVAIPFIESLGAHLIEMGGGRALATMRPRPEHMNSWSVVHGGVLMTLLDFVMAMAGRCAHDEFAESKADARGPSGAERSRAEGSAAGNAGGNLTVEMKTSFIRPAKGVLTIKAQCIHTGRSLSFCEGEIVDAAGQTVARASGTFKFWKT